DPPAGGRRSRRDAHTHRRGRQVGSGRVVVPDLGAPPREPPADARRSAGPPALVGAAAGVAGFSRRGTARWGCRRLASSAVPAIPRYSWPTASSVADATRPCTRTP